MVEKESRKICKMKIIVDANIVFSALLNSNGKIGDILINDGKHFDLSLLTLRDTKSKRTMAR
jgi:predicted nucleic acid-binding protein